MFDEGHEDFAISYLVWSLQNATRHVMLQPCLTMATTGFRREQPDSPWVCLFAAWLASDWPSESWVPVKPATLEPTSCAKCRSLTRARITFSGDRCADAKTSRFRKLSIILRSRPRHPFSVPSGLAESWTRQTPVCSFILPRMKAVEPAKVTTAFISTPTGI